MWDQCRQLNAALNAEREDRRQLEAAFEAEREANAGLRRQLDAAEAEVEAAYEAAAANAAENGSRRPSNFDRGIVDDFAPSRGIAVAPALRRIPSQDSTRRLFRAAAAGDAVELKEAVAAAARGGGGAAEAMMLARDGRGQSLLHAALGGEDGLEAAEFLLEEGKRWSQQRSFILDTQSELLKRQLGAFVDAVDTEGRTPFAALCARKNLSNAHKKLAISLLEAKTDPTCADGAGKTPFIICAEAGNIPLMELLLKVSRGMARLDMDNACRTPLHWAARAGQEFAAQFLLKYRADAEARDELGQSAIQEAQDAGHNGLAKLLMQIVQKGSDEEEDVAEDEDEDEDCSDDDEEEEQPPAPLEARVADGVGEDGFGKRPKKPGRHSQSSYDAM